MTAVVCRHYILCIFILCSEVVQAETFQVNITADTLDASPGNGRCEDINKQCSLRAAIQESNAFINVFPDVDIITLPAGNYILSQYDSSIFYRGLNLTGPLDITEGDLDITDNLIINGAGVVQTTINGEAAQDRIFHIVEGASVSISGVSIIKGHASYLGGGLYQAPSSTLNISDCVIRDNSATIGNGGGIMSKGNITIKNCEIFNNEAGHSGGGISFDQVISIIENSSIHNNKTTVNDGAGILVGNQSVVSITGSVIYNNHAEKNGGGISTIGNGAIIDIINSTISGNTANGAAGGILVYNAQRLEIANSSIAYNYAGMTGGMLAAGTTNLRNSIIANNSDTYGAPDCFSYGVNSQNYNLIGNTNNCIINAQANDQFGSENNFIDPRLAPLSDNGGKTLTHLLLPDSPAINAGNPARTGSGGAACEIFDQRGVERLSGDICDIGSFEAIGGADLSVVISNVTGAEELNADSQITQSVRADNAGPYNATGLSLVVTLPEGSENLGAPSTDWDCVQSANVVTCSKMTLAQSTQSEVLFQFWPVNGKDILLTQARITSATLDPDISNNQFEITVDFSEEELDESDSDGTVFDNSFSESDGSGQDSSTSASDQLQATNNINDTIVDTASDMSLIITTYDINNLDFSQAAGDVNQNGAKTVMTSYDKSVKKNQDDMAALYDRQTKGNINFERAGLDDILVMTTTGAAILTGVLNLFLHSTSLLGVFFTFPLWSRIDPVPTVMVSSTSRKQRKHKAKQDKEAEDKDGRLGRLLD